MVQDNSIGRRTFQTINYLFLSVFALLCLLPFVHVLALSLSENSAAASGKVFFWPVDFTTASYQFTLSKHQFLTSFGISVKRVLLGTSINMLLVVLTAYPLSKEAYAFRFRTVYAWFFVFTMFFSGGLIPMYMIVKTAGIVNSIWSLVLPGAVQVFSIVLLLNFFRGIPRELEESAFMDGAGHLTILVKIFLPASLPAIATLTLFSIVNHWNSWFDGLIYMNTPYKYPLQSYLQTVIVKIDPQFMKTGNLSLISLISEKTLKSAQIFLAALPVLLIYPFLQRFFVKGLVLGSVKG